MNATAPTPSPAAGPARILVVDDDALDRLTVRRCLQQSGISARLDEAASAAEAIEMVRPAAYDCVLLDYYMPGVDSVSLLRSFQAAAVDVPVVIFTGQGDEEVAVEFMKAGAADYLPKASLSPERLATSFRYAVEVSRSAAARRSAETALREREAEFRTLANSIPQMAWICDPPGRWYDYTGSRPDESLGLGWHLVHHPERRSGAIASLAAALSRGDVWEETVHLRRRDGVYRWFLTRAMPVRDAQGSILRWVGTNTDITEHKEGELERERLLALEQAARAQAERATKARDEVLAIVAHDLRNPIQTISMCASVLTQAADQDNRQRLAGIIERSTGEMERLISDLLDVARIESGTFSILKERVDVGALLADAVEQFEPQALVRRVSLASDVGEVVPVMADRLRLLQVLSNLLDNAVKFTPEGGSIRVRGRAIDGAVQISVEDSGKGISAENLPHIFDRFWQANRASRAGAGLGLAICKGIVEAHGGRIWATSIAGSGTSIHITLPER
jgi:PAS domain S-box-containing protein